MTGARLFLALSLGCVLAPKRSVLGLIKYPVYFNTTLEPDRNPMGEGWLPLSPDQWKRVNSASYKSDGFFQYHKRSSGEISYSGNECKDRFYMTKRAGDVDVDPDSDHRQSPTILQRSKKPCTDNHGMMYDRGNCKSSDIRKTTISPYGLRVEFRRCSERVDVDVSGCGKPWSFMGLEIKSPSEHVIRDGDSFIKYDGEIHLLHRGAGSQRNVKSALLIGVFLEARSNYTDNEELEKYINNWERKERQIYDLCDVEFDDSTCSLKKRENKTEILSTFAFDQEAKSTVLRANGGNRELQEVANEPTRYDPYNLFRKTGTKFFYKLRGTLTHPPCFDKVEWRIMKLPLKISKSQMNRIDDLIARMVNKERCVLGTVGDYRKDGTCHVNTNRPLQFAAGGHEMRDCNEWYKKV